MRLGSRVNSSWATRERIAGGARASYDHRGGHSFGLGFEGVAPGWYDNSRNNPHNPDPDAAVRWGDQTYDEMMVGFFDVAVPAGLDKQRYFIRTPAARAGESTPE